MKKLLLLSIAILLVSCKSKSSNNFIVDDDGITTEKPAFDRPYDENYNTNNVIFNVGKTFTYSYYYEDQAGKKFLVKKGKDIQEGDLFYQGFDFVSEDKIDNETITKIILRALPGNPFPDVPNYNQTAISYDYIMKDGKSFSMEITGAIENEKNIWIHPPRTAFFEILELNPFPYIKAPYHKGTKWTWNLEIGDHWSDKRWLEWKGSIKNKYSYEIMGNERLQTNLGDLECYIVKANATSRIGSTELISHFNEKYGFIKLDYTNIDGTKTILTLIEVN